MSGIRTRVLKVTISVPGGSVVLDQSLNLRIRINKAALAIQNKAVIEVTNLTQTTRQQLLSNFTAWQKSQRDQFGVLSPYWPVTIEAGYISPDTTSTVSTIYTGEVVMCDLTQGPPNVTVRITAYTNQVDKTKYISDPLPYSMTYRQLVFHAGKIMGFDDSHVICQTSYDDNIVENAAQSIMIASAMLPYIQDYYHPDVSAYIDDGFLIVKDRNKTINPGDIAQMNEFVGMPNWTEWGFEGVALMDSSIRLSGAVEVTSILNPSLNGQWVVTQLEYDLSSRDSNFYVKVSGTPPAA